MNIITINTSSVTYAIKAKKLLERSGIKAALVKSNLSEKKESCAYGIRIESSFLYDAVSILKKNGIEYSVKSDL